MANLIDIALITTKIVTGYVVAIVVLAFVLHFALDSK